MCSRLIITILLTGLLCSCQSYTPHQQESLLDYYQQSQAQIYKFTQENISDIAEVTSIKTYAYKFLTSAERLDSCSTALQKNLEEFQPEDTKDDEDKELLKERLERQQKD